MKGALKKLPVPGGSRRIHRIVQIDLGSRDIAEVGLTDSSCDESFRPGISLLPGKLDGPVRPVEGLVESAQMIVKIGQAGSRETLLFGIAFLALKRNPGRVQGLGDIPSRFQCIGLPDQSGNGGGLVSDHNPIVPEPQDLPHRGVCARGYGRFEAWPCDQPTRSRRSRHESGSAEKTPILGLLPGGRSTRCLRIQPGELRVFSDIVGRLGLEGSGVLEVSSPGPLIPEMRTYNRSNDGTFGQYIPGETIVLEGFKQHFGAGFLPGVQENEDFRSNIGVYNPAETSTEYRMELHSDDGSILGTSTVTIPARSAQQFNHVVRKFGLQELSAGYLRVSGGLFGGYVAFVDNLSGDASTVTPEERPPLARVSEAAVFGEINSFGSDQAQARISVFDTQDFSLVARPDPDSRGRYSVALPGAGTYWIVVGTPGECSAGEWIDVMDSPVEANLLLVPPDDDSKAFRADGRRPGKDQIGTGTVSVLVLDACADEGIAHADVRLVNIATGLIAASEETRPDGRVTFNDVRVDLINVNPRASQHGPLFTTEDGIFIFNTTTGPAFQGATSGNLEVYLSDSDDPDCSAEKSFDLCDWEYDEQLILGCGEEWTGSYTTTLSCSESIGGVTLSKSGTATGELSFSIDSEGSINGSARDHQLITATTPGCTTTWDGGGVFEITGEVSTGGILRLFFDDQESFSYLVTTRCEGVPPSSETQTGSAELQYAPMIEVEKSDDGRSIHFEGTHTVEHVGTYTIVLDATME